MRAFARPSGLQSALRTLGAIGIAAAIATSAVAAGQPAAAEQPPAVVAAEQPITVGVAPESITAATAEEPITASGEEKSATASAQEEQVATTAEEETMSGGVVEQPTWSGAEKQSVAGAGAEEPAADAADEQLASADPTAMAPVSPLGGPAPRPMTYLDPPFERVPAEGKAIFVNIPSYELIAFEDGREVLRSRVIVGSPKNPTPEMTTETSVVSFRPTWTPTPEMIRDEGMTPETRPPGRNNPLGLLAIRFEAGNLIYLHDTNNRKLFSREKRALSHGCVRVERWDEVAAFVLGIPVEEVRRNAEGKRSFNMETEGIPVVVRYKTKFPDEAGIMREYADVYGKQARFAKALKEKPRKTPEQPRTNWDALPSQWSF